MATGLLLLWARRRPQDFLQDVEVVATDLRRLLKPKPLSILALAKMVTWFFTLWFWKGFACGQAGTIGVNHTIFPVQ